MSLSCTCRTFTVFWTLNQKDLSRTSTVSWNLRIPGTVHNCSCGASTVFWIFWMIGILSGQLVVSQQSSGSSG